MCVTVALKANHGLIRLKKIRLVVSNQTAQTFDMMG
jgi:hypothetical protein